MALSNAERQKRYRQRLRALAASGGYAVQRLNEAYSAAAVEQRERSLQAIKREMDQSTDQEFVLVIEDMISRLLPPSYEWTLDDWCNIAQQIGQKDEAASILEARKEALQQMPKKSRDPWAPFNKVSRG